jgi:DNA-binding response OmpR family regulator
MGRQCGRVAVLVRREADVTILIVEDALAEREAIRSMLEAPGRLVLAAANEADALAVAHFTHVDLLITDITVPGTSGPKIAQRLRAVQPDVCIIFISGWYELPSLAGETALRKPFTTEELNGAVHAILGRRCQP